MQQNPTNTPQAFRTGVSEEQLLGCMRCGFCLPTCPTYAITGDEADSPRGRLALVRFAQTGQLEATAGFDSHTYACLQCEACNAVCPAGVPVAELIREAREVLHVERKQPATKDFLFRRFMQNMAWMERASLPIKIAQRLGLMTLAQATGIARLLPKHMGDLQPSLPNLSWQSTRKTLSGIIPARGQRRFRVGYFLSCMDNLAYPHSARALVHLLTGAGCEVVIPPELVCCGMPHRTYGDREATRMVARKNLAAFANESLDAVLTDCASCGAALRDYESLFAGEPEESPAIAFAAKVVDVSEWLVRINWQPARALGRKLTVTYHQPCHLGRAQGVISQPRNLLKSIDGIEWIEMKEADWCCGGAGSYNLTHFEHSMKVLDRKMGNLAATGAEIVATGCPACQMQLSLGVSRAKLNVQVVHPVHLMKEVAP